MFADALVPLAGGRAWLFHFQSHCCSDRSRHFGRDVLRCSAWRGSERCGNGYRFPKPQGKPNPANVRNPLRHRHFCKLLATPCGRAFTPRSSRYLNCPSNLIGHDHLNKPANGVGVSDGRAGAALGKFAVNKNKGELQ
ncbi:MAG TPA: hypothetical protein VGH62_17410, partial [Bradyrhizobium sp.]